MLMMDHLDDPEESVGPRTPRADGPISDDVHRAEAAVQPVAGPKPRAKRRGLTDEERLAKALSDVESLQAKVVAKRDERRRELIEDLYARHSIDAAADDPGEARRIARLRAELGLQ